MQCWVRRRLRVTHRVILDKWLTLLLNSGSGFHAQSCEMQTQGYTKGDVRSRLRVRLTFRVTGSVMLDANSKLDLELESV